MNLQYHKLLRANTVKSIGLVVCFWLLNSETSFSQSYINYLGELSVVNSKFNFSPSSPEIDGSNFFFKNWSGGKVQFINGAIEKIDKMNIDTYSNVIVFEENKVKYALPTNLVANIQINDEFFEKHLIDQNATLCKKLAGDSTLSLLLYTKTSITVGRESNGFVAAENDKYVQHISYYIKVQETMHEIKPNKGKMLYEILQEDMAAELKVYLESKNIKLKSSEDLIAAVNYCCSLETKD